MGPPHLSHSSYTIINPLHKGQTRSISLPQVWSMPVNTSSNITHLPLFQCMHPSQLTICSCALMLSLNATMRDRYSGHTEATYLFCSMLGDSRFSMISRPPLLNLIHNLLSLLSRGIFNFIRLQTFSLLAGWPLTTCRIGRPI